MHFQSLTNQKFLLKRFQKILSTIIMSYQTNETISLTNEAGLNLPKEEESSSHHKWLRAVAAALVLGVGTMVVSSSSSSSSLSSSLVSNGNPAIHSEVSLNKESLVEKSEQPCGSFFQSLIDGKTSICGEDCCWKPGTGCEDRDPDNIYCYSDYTDDGQAYSACKYTGPESWSYDGPFNGDDFMCVQYTY
mmetsp:Transcript_25855/g.26295  ORF Transcript_25855/g.26295 Transcript_25855/m.26295 type:complete len:190 (+) Transcript_25855:13-582(+)